MGDTARQLTEGIDLLRLPKVRFGLGEASLIAEPVGDVVHELKGADQCAAAITQRIKFHFVVPARCARFPKFVYRSEFLTR